MIPFLCGSLLFSVALGGQISKPAESRKEKGEPQRNDIPRHATVTARCYNHASCFNRGTPKQTARFSKTCEVFKTSQVSKNSLTSNLRTDGVSIYSVSSTNLSALTSRRFNSSSSFALIPFVS